MRVNMITSEAKPFLKVGGLGDVTYSLSRKMVVYKIPTSITMPYYRNIRENKLGLKIEKVSTFEVKMAWRRLQCDIYKTIYQGITYYFVNNDFYFDREKPYGYLDDQERFAFFQLASVQMIYEMELAFEILHIHDWQTGMIPLIYDQFYEGKLKKEPKFIYTIHNPAFLGLVDRKDLYDYFTINESYFDNGLTRLDNKVSYLKTGIMTSDRITTVSPTHARELLNGFAGRNLQSCLEYRKGIVRGIINGLDVKEWNPDTDPFIDVNYNKENVLSRKVENKVKFAQEMGFKDPSLPLFSIVARLTEQKGLDLILDSLKEMMEHKCNVFILGTGQEDIENKIAYYQSVYPDNFVAKFMYSEELSHKVYAASDFFLMPSRFEPCGITQMISHRYGTLPLARATGGLVDTIIPYNGSNHDVADGLLFTEYNKNSYLVAFKMALELYKHKRPFSKVVHNAMDVDHSWKKSYLEFRNLYLEAMGRD